MRHVRVSIDFHFAEAGEEIEERLNEAVEVLVDNLDGVPRLAGWSHDIRFFGCDHEHDDLSIQRAPGAEGIVDVVCRHCGRPGSFSVPTNEINWED